MAAVTTNPAPDAFPPAVDTTPEASRRSMWAVGGALAAAMLLAGGSWYALRSRGADVSSPDETTLSSRLPAQPPADVKPESPHAQTPESIGNTPDPGSKAIVQGPAEETAVSDEQRRGRDEAERTAQAQPSQDGRRARLEDARPENVQAPPAERRLAPAPGTEAGKAEPEAQPRREAAAQGETNTVDADA